MGGGGGEASMMRAEELFKQLEDALSNVPDGERARALGTLTALRSELQNLAGDDEPQAAAIPARPAAADAMQAAETTDHKMGGPAMCKMLIVEDSIFQAMTMLALAEESGYTAQVVASAGDALEVLRHDEDVNLVLTDVMMEGVDGFQLLMKIRSEYKAHIAVVMMSAHESDGLVEQCVMQGADAFLLKPMRLLELKNLWQYVWRRRHEAVLRRTVPAELMGANHATDEGAKRPILRPDEAQRDTAHNLDSFEQGVIAETRSLQQDGLEATLAEVERMGSVKDLAAARDAAADSAIAATEDGEVEMAVCKLCEQSMPRAHLKEHVVSCAAAHVTHERVREIDLAMRKTASLLDARHTKLELAADELRAQVATLQVLKQALTEAAAIGVGGTHAPQQSAMLLEQIVERAEKDLTKDGRKRSAIVSALWERVRKLPRSKISACWDVIAVESGASGTDREGAGGGSAGSKLKVGLGAGRKVSMKDFDIVDVLGSGGYGTVYLARRRSTKDLVAIKALTKAHLRETNALENVQLERLILSSAQSPFVVELYFSFMSPSNVYMVMEYMPRGDLHELLNQLGFFEEDLAAFYLGETVAGLAYLHSQGVIMRDLKPQNMLIGADGHLKLTDFGLSAAYHGATLEDSSMPPNAGGTAPSRAEPPPAGGAAPAERPKPDRKKDGTRNVGVNGGSRCISGWFGGGQCVGTPNYLAPEVLLHRRVTYALDLWALGIVMYEFLVGEPPFDDDTPEQIFENIVARRMNHSIINSLSKPAASLVRQLLAPDDKQRISIPGVQAHAFFEGVDWERLREVEPSIKPALRHSEDAQARWAGADLEPGGVDEEEEEDEAFSTFESKNVRKLALMHLTEAAKRGEKQ